MSEDFISGLHADLVEAMDRYERRSPRGRLAAGRYPRLLRRATLARIAAGAALIVALVAVVLTVARESDVERPAAPPGKKLVATDVEAGVRFSLDGRVLTVQLLPPDAQPDLRNGQRRARSARPAARTSPRRRVIRGARPRSPGSGRPARRA